MSEFTPSPTQTAALNNIASWFATWRRDDRQIFYLAGYAGVGKTEIAARSLQQLAVPYSAACYTGKAASMLRRRGIRATTIHALMYRLAGEHNGNILFELKGDSAIEHSGLIMIDEGGMVGNDIARDLLSFRKPILVTADPAQLPPINGTGFLIEREPDVLLTEIHRQAAGSPVLALATDIREGRALPCPPYEVENEAGSVAIRQANVLDVLRPDYQIICGVHRVRWDVTRIIRQQRGFSGSCPHPGERVVCIQNDRTEGILNGMMGTVTAPAGELLANGNLRLRIHLDDEPAPRTFLVDRAPFQEHEFRRRIGSIGYADVCRFDFAYVLTCHKAQGDQFENVVLIDDSKSFREHSNKWKYTGITRAQKNLIILVR